MKKLSAYDVYKTIHTSLSNTDGVSVVAYNPNRAVYSMNSKYGYYTFDITTRCENSIVGTYSIFHHADSMDFWDVYSGFICTGENPENTVHRLLGAIARYEYELSLENPKAEYC